MANSTEQIETQALRLPQEDRAKLAQVLLLSLGESDDEDVEALWAEEAERRYREIERGEVTAIPSQDVLRDARARLK